MRYSYPQLKRALGVAGGPRLDAFERYCRAMDANTRALEWSCKSSAGAIEGARFLHTARVQSYEAARPAVDRLLADLFGAAGVAGHPVGWLRPLAERLGEGVAVGYAEAGAPGSRRTEVKVYVSTSRVADAAPVIETFVPDAGGPPDGTHKVMVAASIDEQRGGGPRVYYLWRRGQLAAPAAARWLERWCTDEERELIAANDGRTVSVAFKEGRRDMVYLSAPFRQPEVRRMVADHLSVHPLPCEQLDNLRWIGFSKRGEGLRARELNAYFHTAGLGRA